MTSRATTITAIVATLVAASAIAAPAALADPPYNTTSHVTYVPPDPPLRTGTPVASATSPAYVPPDPPLRDATPVASSAGQALYVPPDPPLRVGTSVASLTNLSAPHTQYVNDTASGTGFSWSAAAIGAIATAAMCLLVIGVVRNSRRSSDPKPA